MKKILKILALGFLPVLMLALALKLCESRGPFYLQVNSDPCYPYLINSLNIALLNPINQVDNPGISVVVIGGITIRSVAFLKGIDNIEEDVIRNPEFYLETINRVFIGLNVIALFLLGVFALKFTGSLAIACFLQCAPFISAIPLVRLTKVSPEPVLMFTCMALIITLLWVIFKDPQLKKANRLTWIFALITAFGLCTKLTFIAFAIIPLFVLPGVKRKFSYAALTLVFFHFFFIPGMLHYQFLLNWIARILTHTQTYGNGPQGFIEWQAFKAALIEIFTFEYALYIAVLFALVTLIIVYAGGRLHKQSGVLIESKILAGLVLAVLIHLILVAKHFQFHPYHYLIPAMMLSTLFIYLALRLIAGAFPDERFLKVMKPMCFVALLLYIPFHIQRLNFQNVFSYLEKDKNDYFALNDFIETHYPGYSKLLAGPVSSPYYALREGAANRFLPPQNFFPTMEKFYGKENVYFYNYTVNRFLTWTDITDLNSILEKHERIMLQGLNGDLPMKGIELFEKVHEGGNESVYVLK